MTKKITKKQLVKERLDELFDKKELVTKIQIYPEGFSYTDQDYRSYEVRLCYQYMKENNITSVTKRELPLFLQNRFSEFNGQKNIYFRPDTYEILIRDNTIDKILND